MDRHAHVQSDELSRHEHAIVTGLLDAYRAGYFPMADPRSGGIHWFSPDPRAIIPLEAFHAPRSLLQRTRSGRFHITSDVAFNRVIRACADPRADGKETWISEELVHVYTLLHRAGHAHSVEAWVDPNGTPTLVGGLYGVAIGGLFAGESMFSRPALGGTDASKVCLVHLVQHLRARGYTLLDSQFTSPHLERFGCVEIPRTTYLRLLRDAMERDVAWEPWSALNERT